jgi:hypothetical protein
MLIEAAVMRFKFRVVMRSAIVFSSRDDTPCLLPLFGRGAQVELYFISAVSRKSAS